MIKYRDKEIMNLISDKVEGILKVKVRTKSKEAEQVRARVVFSHVCLSLGYNCPDISNYLFLNRARVQRYVSTYVHKNKLKDIDLIHSIYSELKHLKKEQTLFTKMDMLKFANHIHTDQKTKKLKRINKLSIINEWMNKNN